MILHPQQLIWGTSKNDGFLDVSLFPRGLFLRLQPPAASSRGPNGQVWESPVDWPQANFHVSHSKVTLVFLSSFLFFFLLGFLF